MKTVTISVALLVLFISSMALAQSTGTTGTGQGQVQGQGQAQGQGPGSGQGPGLGQGSGQKKGPPPEAIAACTGKSEGVACSFTAPHGTMTGTCGTSPHGDFACRPKDRPVGGGGPGGPGQ